MRGGSGKPRKQAKISDEFLCLPTKQFGSRAVSVAATPSEIGEMMLYLLAMPPSRRLEKMPT